MKKILLLVLVFAFSINMNAQILGEDFESGSLPSGWQTVTPSYNAGSGNDFKWHPSSYNGDHYMRASSYSSGSNFETVQWLISPSFSTISLTGLSLIFENDKADYPGNDLQVFISTNYDGDSSNFATATWNEITGLALSSGGYTVTENVSDISTYIGNASVYVGFKYTSTSSAGAVWDVDSVYVTSTSSINSVQQAIVTIYPNPTTDLIFFNSGNNSNNVEIFNTLGQKVLVANNVKNSVNVATLKEGVYTVVIENENGRMVQKFVKK